ncbi:hypothetical protein PG999_002978 [Apiospora kogelbergensis]|uniref:Haloacid dehalogenase n=1 Tax=Apiospora kogelbergensis TaxID=1337665 RepID=A0AAW0R9X2_9PEZI
MAIGIGKPNLLLCFDAFGTLFKPKHTVALQYAEIARQCGITNFTDKQVHSSFKRAFEEESKRNPNYGSGTALGATRWWHTVIYETFWPILKRTDQKPPPDLIPKLMHRFASKDGYDAEPGLVSALRTLKHQNYHRRYNEIVIGVITNSDDRVPGILSSFGLNVSPLRYGVPMNEEDAAAAMAKKNYDIDFHCMSYDVGYEKPDRRIFDAAEHMLAQIIAARDGMEPGGTEALAMAQTWRKVYVGDEHIKDVLGASAAGWDPVLFEPGVTSDDAIPTLNFAVGQTLPQQFKEFPTSKVVSIQDLVQSLAGWK